MSKKGVFVLAGLLVLIICLISCCLVFVIALSSDTQLSANESTLLPSGARDQTVAVIDLAGTISETPATSSSILNTQTTDMTSVVIDKLERARKDSNVKAVLIRVNSPGGEVYATRKIYNKIIEVKNANKIVVVLMESQAASGGYYASAPADWIVASEMTMTGSIGVRFSTYDMQELYKKIGVKEVNIANTEGKLKVMNDLSENSEGYKVMQSLANDYYDNFVTVVADGRKMSKEQVIKVADGRIYSGKQALNNGLIDQLGELKEAADKSKELANLDNPNFVVYQDQSNAFSMYNVSLLNLLVPEAKIISDKMSNGGLFAYYLMSY
ncbi:MAG: signal peptide peptidase SppA [bacterium]